MKLSTTYAPGISVVSIRGSLDFFTSPSLQRAVATLLEDGSEHIVFDLSNLDHLDRAGIEVLVGTATQMGYADRRVSLVCGSGPVRSALERSHADLRTVGALAELDTRAA